MAPAPPGDRQRAGYPHGVINMKRVANQLVNTAGNPAGLLPGCVHSQLRLRSNQLAKRRPNGGRPDVRAMHGAGRRACRDYRSQQGFFTMCDRDLGALGWEV